MNKSFKFINNYDKQKAKRILVKHDLFALPVLDKKMRLKNIIFMKDFL